MLFNYNDDAGVFFGRAGELKTDLEKVKQFDRKNIAAKLAEIIKG